MLKHQSGQQKGNELRFTNDHDWVQFEGQTALIGVCPFKLIGFKEVHRLSFLVKDGHCSAGKLLATISYEDYLVEVHSPFDGTLQATNAAVSDNPNLLLKCPDLWLVVMQMSYGSPNPQLMDFTEYRGNHYHRVWHQNI